MNRREIDERENQETSETADRLLSGSEPKGPVLSRGNEIKLPIGDETDGIERDQPSYNAPIDTLQRQIGARELRVLDKTMLLP